MERYGLEICRATESKSGSVYPALRRMEDYAWLSSRWEDVAPSEIGRPRKRFYRLTDEGLRTAREVCEGKPRRTARVTGGLLAGT